MLARYVQHYLVLYRACRAATRAAAARAGRLYAPCDAPAGRALLLAKDKDSLGYRPIHS